MICPHCLRTIEDGSSFCPYCDGYVEDAPASHDLVFCEGCGARLSPRDRVCPKCGRPAPTILSSDRSAEDLAAGKTASFPALAGDAAIGSERGSGASLDPDLTNRLHVEDRLDAVADSAAADPYHPRPRRRMRAAVVSIALVALAAAGVFLYFDPLGLLPSLGASFKQAASEAFPSTQPEPAPDSAPAEPDDAPLSDEDAYAQLDAAYVRLVSYHDSFGDVIDDFNGYYAAYDRTLREDASKSAYGMRDGIDATIEELQGMRLEEGSPRADEVAALVELAEALRPRAQALCDCWDISLAVPEGEQPDGDEVLAPLRASYRDGGWYDRWDEAEGMMGSCAPAETD